MVHISLSQPCSTIWNESFMYICIHRFIISIWSFFTIIKELTFDMIILTGKISTVEGVKCEAEQCFCIGFLPQFCPCVSIPKNEGVRRMEAHQQVSTGILIVQPLHALRNKWECELQNLTYRASMEYSTYIYVIKSGCKYVFKKCCYQVVPVIICHKH